jgi:hypothetical protein
MNRKDRRASKSKGHAHNMIRIDLGKVGYVETCTVDGCRKGSVHPNPGVSEKAFDEEFMKVTERIKGGDFRSIRSLDASRRF